MKSLSHGIVTGAGRGIGLSVAETLLEKKISVTAITRSINKKLENLKKKYKNKLNVVIYDLENLEEIDKLIEKCFINNKTSFLVNNAGVRSRHKLNMISYEELNKVIDINLLSPYLVTKAYLKRIKFSQLGHSIVSITSIVGPRGFDELSSYASSKGGLEAGMRSLAIEYASKNVRINCVAPGFIKTSFYNSFKKNKPKLFKWTKERTPMRRWGNTKEVADVVEFLVSNKSSYITGTVINVDGGWLSNS